MLNQKILSSFSDKNVLVTGGTGMIGRQVVTHLCNNNANVTSVSLDKVPTHSKANQIYGDLTELFFCKEITQGQDCVFHLAGVKGSMEVSKTMIASHFVPTLMINCNVLEACRLSNVSKVLYTSSIGAYANNTDTFKEIETEDFGGPPLDFAGWAKRMGELQIHAYKAQYGLTHFSIVRPSAVYGPGDNFDPKNAMVIPSLMAHIYKNEKPLEIWGDGSAVRDIAFSKDIAEGIILALYHGTNGSYVNLGSGHGYSIKEVVEALKSFLDFEYIFDTSKPSGSSKKLLDISLAKEHLGYSPQNSLLEGLKETWAWFIDNVDEHKRKQNYFQAA